MTKRSLASQVIAAVKLLSSRDSWTRMSRLTLVFLAVAALACLSLYAVEAKPHHCEDGTNSCHEEHNHEDHKHEDHKHEEHKVEDSDESSSDSDEIKESESSSHSLDHAHNDHTHHDHAHQDHAHHDHN